MAFGRTAAQIDERLRRSALADVRTGLTWLAIDQYFREHDQKRPLPGRVGFVPRELYEKALACHRANGGNVPEGYSGPITIDSGHLWPYTIKPEEEA